MRSEQCKPLKWAFCKGLHKVTQCDAIPDHSNRIDIVKQSNCVSIALVTIESVNASQRVAVSIAGNDTKLVYAEKH